MTLAPDLRAAEFLAALQGLMPRGLAWPREPGSVQQRVLAAFAARLEALHLRSRALSEQETDPAQATETLADWERAFGLPDDCSPNTRFSRASVATYLDAAGALRTAGINILRTTPDGDPIVEPAGSNLIRNPRGEGGGAGLQPTNWLVEAGGGLGLALLGAGEDGNIPYYEARIYGTALGGGASYLAIYPESVGAVPALTGQAWTYSHHQQLGAGALNPPSGLIHYLSEQTAGFATVRTGSLAAPPPTAAALAAQQPASSFTTSGGVTVASILPASIYYFDAGPTDLTLRFALPQLEPGGAATSRILPPVDAPAGSTRAADVYYAKSGADRRAALLARIASQGGQSRAYFIAVAAALGVTITITEFRPARAGVLRAGDPCCGPDWIFAWQVNAPANTLSFARAGLMVAGDPLQSWGNATLECVLNRLKPARSTLLFGYT